LPFWREGNDWRKKREDRIILELGSRGVKDWISDKTPALISTKKKLKSTGRSTGAVMEKASRLLIGG